MRNPDKARSFLITLIIVFMTLGTPFISSIFLINGIPGKEDPSITSNDDFTNNYSVKSRDYRNVAALIFQIMQPGCNHFP